MDYQVFSFIQRSNTNSQDQIDFYSLNADYYGEVHLRRHQANKSQLTAASNQETQTLTQNQECDVFDNQVRVTKISTSLDNPHQIIFGDNEGNLKLLRIEEKLKENILYSSLVPLIHSDNVTNFKRINDITWMSNQELLVLGNDNSINVVDSSTLQSCFRINTKHSTPVTATTHPTNTSLALTGFEDGYIKLFDLRKNHKKAERFFKSHFNGISKLIADPIRSDLFLSAGFDGKVKVWDFRSDVPLYSIDVASGAKILALQWVDRVKFFSAGDDTRLTLHSLTADN